jgi:NAD-dependent deacetylase
MVDEARRILAAAREVMVLTGAGISAESGVPTFRGEGGLWKRYRAEELATPQAFARDPRLVWEWYAWRRGLIEACDPNPGHLALAHWASRRPGVTLVTQNVDGLHEVAQREAGTGAPLPEIVEIHGSLFRSRCTVCGARRAHREPVVTDALDTLPSCSECDGLLRPDVVWFGEALEERVLTRAVEAATGCDACLVVGTSGLVHPAAGLPGLTLDQGGAVIEVNLDPTPLSHGATVSIRGEAGKVLPILLSQPRSLD